MNRDVITVVVFYGLQELILIIMYIFNRCHNVNCQNDNKVFQHRKMQPCYWSSVSTQKKFRVVIGQVFQHRKMQPCDWSNVSTQKMSPVIGQVFQHRKMQPCDWSIVPKTSPDWKNVHRLSERLAHLDMMAALLGLPLNPLIPLHRN